MAFNGNSEKIKSHWYELLRSDSSDVCPDGGAGDTAPASIREWIPRNVK